MDIKILDLNIWSAAVNINITIIYNDINKKNRNAFTVLNWFICSLLENTKYKYLYYRN